MRVDQSRDEDVVREADLLVLLEPRECFLRRKNLLDGAVAHRDGVMLEDRARRLDRDDPAGAEKLSLYLGVP
jgi:hypothetical protein